MNSDIFNIAKSLFYEKGYSKTKIGDITGRLGLVPANFYRHYDSKEELLKDIVTGEINEYIKLLKEFQNKNSFHEQIKLILETNLRLLFEKPHFFSLLMEIKCANYKLDRSTINIVNSINNTTRDSLDIILEQSNLDPFTKRIAHRILINDLNIFLENLIKDSRGDIRPAKLMTTNFDEEFNNLFNLIKSVCYGLGISSDVFSKLDDTTGLLKEEFFLELLTKSYNCIAHQKSTIDILYITISGYDKNSNGFFIQTLFHSIGKWLKSSFRDSDQSGFIGDNNFALLLSEHPNDISPLILNRCSDFEISLKEKYPTLDKLKLEVRFLSIQEGQTIDFKSFFASEDTIEEYTVNKKAPFIIKGQNKKNIRTN